MPLWAKMDVGLRHHPKLIGRPDADFRLWVGLILHAKEHCQDFIIRDLSPSDMRGAFGVKAPVRAVEAALAYFISKEMLIRQPDGGLLVKDMEERQGTVDTTNERARRYYDSNRETIREKRKVSRVRTNGVSHGVSHAVSRENVSLEVEVEVEKEEEKEQKKEIIAQSPENRAPTPFAEYVAFEWPDLKNPLAFEARCRSACPAVDPLAEAKKARGWELADPRHRKVKHGNFFWNWVMRAQQDANKNAPRGDGMLAPILTDKQREERAKAAQAVAQMRSKMGLA